MKPFQSMRRIWARELAVLPSHSGETKESAVGGLGGDRQLWLTGPGSATWTGRRYDRFADEGYRKNVIAFRAVRLLAEGAASVPWLLYAGRQERREHPLLDLLRRPNPLQGGMSLFEDIYGFLLIAGNAYVEAVENARGLPAELYALRPDRMKVLPGAKGWPRGYQYSVGGKAHVFAQDAARGVAPVLHLKMFHPLDDHYGLSPMEAAAYGIDLHNAAGHWNKALLDNAARPSGALVYDPGEKGASLTQAQFERLKAEMEAQFQGGGNAGRPLLLEGGLTWQQLGFSPADMDFIEGKHVSAREIALAFGVPPMLLGIPGDSTYANYAEANKALWRQTILPLLEKVTAALNGWLAPKFGEGLRLDFDTDAIDALSADRAQKWQQLAAADFLTVNEKRQALGYEPLAGGDMLRAASPFGGMAAKSAGAERTTRFAALKEEHEAAKAAGRTMKVWRTAEDGQVRESHAAVDGVAVGIDEDFVVGGERLFLPSDPAGSLGETANCRCRVEYRIGDVNDPDNSAPPLLKSTQARRKSIIENIPSVFKILDNTEADSSKPWYEIDEFSEAVANDSSIVRESEK